MATLKANGTEIFRYSNIRRDGSRGPERRVMLSGKVLVKRIGGGFKVVATIRHRLTFGEAAELLANNGLVVNWQAPAETWRGRSPMSTRMTAKGRPGILRAMVEAQA